MANKINFNNFKQINIDNSNSTLDIAHNYCLDNNVNTIAFSYFQTSGRGRGSNSWITDSKNPNFHLAICISKKDLINEVINYLPFIVARTNFTLFSNFSDDIFCKWPNDIMIAVNKEWYKLSGTLIELKSNFVNIGVGINFNKVSFSRAYSLEELTGKVFIEDELLQYKQNFLQRFEDLLSQFFDNPSLFKQKIINHLNDYALKQFKNSKCMYNNSVFKVKKISNDGSLIIANETQEQKILSDQQILYDKWNKNSFK